MAVASKGKASDEIVLHPLQLTKMVLLIIGETPLLVHKFSEKARQQMLAKQMGKHQPKKEHKNPFEDFCGSMYWIDKMPEHPVAEDVERARFGFPVIALKAAAVTACTSIGGITKVLARQSFSVQGDSVDPETQKQLVRIYSPNPPFMSEEAVKVGMTTDIRYRGQFDPWHVYLCVKYNKNVISPEQVANMLNTAGFGVGIGEWRPERDGMLGTFRVGSQKEFEAYQRKDQVKFDWFYND